MRQKCRVTAEREEYKKVLEVAGSERRKLHGFNRSVHVGHQSCREIKSCRETKSCRGQGISMTEAVTTPGVALWPAVPFAKMAGLRHTSTSVFLAGFATFGQLIHHLLNPNRR